MLYITKSPIWLYLIAEVIRRSILNIFVPLAVVSLFLVYAAPVFSAVDLNEKIASGKYVQKVDAFEVIVDATESMNEIYKGKSKLNQEKALITLFNNTIPNIKLNAAARAFGQFTTFGDPKSKLLFGPEGYTKSALPEAIAPIARGMGSSPLDAALDGATSDLKSQRGQLAVIVFSDGEDMKKYEPIAAAKRMKDTFGDRVCIYTVVLGDKAVMYQFGDLTEGIDIMKQVADAGKCGSMVTGDSISSPEGMAAFVEKVFLTIDSDGDGVADDLDKCPDTPAGVKVDKDGCPLDSDGDGVPDYLDKCPGTPAGVKVDKDGCPPVAAPVVKEMVEKEQAPVIVEQGKETLNVHFDFDKADIKPEYRDDIGRLGEVLKKYPDLNITIEGHTDSVGDTAYNDKLSQQRADAVKNYLVQEFGIDAARLNTKGYGERLPVAPNTTKEGRQKNRRVEAVAEYTIKK